MRMPVFGIRLIRKNITPNRVNLSKKNTEEFYYQMSEPVGKKELLIFPEDL